MHLLRTQWRFSMWQVRLLHCMHVQIQVIVLQHALCTMRCLLPVAVLICKAPLPQLN